MNDQTETARSKTMILEVLIPADAAKKAVRAGLLAWDNDERAYILTDEGRKQFEAQQAKREAL